MRSYVRRRSVYAEPQASGLIAWMVEAHPSTPKKLMIIQSQQLCLKYWIRLTYFVPALTATIKEASNVVIRASEVLLKGGGTGEEDIALYASQALGFEGRKSIWAFAKQINLALALRK